MLPIRYTRPPVHLANKLGRSCDDKPRGKTNFPA